jgi:hypothetical protein
MSHGAVSVSHLSGLTSRHRHGRTHRGPRCVIRRRRRPHRDGSRFAARCTIDGLQIGGERPGRARTARVVLLQVQEERESEATLGKTACAAMTCRATVGKQLGNRFALIEILGVCRSTDQHGNYAKGEQTAPQSPWQRPFRRWFFWSCHHFCNANAISANAIARDCARSIDGANSTA